MAAVEHGGTVVVTSSRQTVGAASAAQSVGIVTGILEGEAYAGPYEVTPGAQPVTLTTAGLTMAQNVTVGAIPSNYGRITWDGSIITVS